MARTPYDAGFLRDWIRRMAESPARRWSHHDRSPQTTYEHTFRWDFGAGQRPNLFLFRASTSPLAGADYQLTPFDAVLIDGHHDYEWVRHDLAERGAYVRPGGVILVHRARGGFDRALTALHAWAAAPGGPKSWPHEGSLAVAKVFEDLREAALGTAGMSSGERLLSEIELRDLREDFEHEAANDGRLERAG